MPNTRAQAVKANGDTTTLRHAGQTTGQPLRLCNVSKSFRSETGAWVQAVSDVSIEAYPGEVVSIVGPSGCGKSTLLMIAAGLLNATAGHAYFGDIEIREPHPALGIAFQRDCLLEWRNVRNNILLQVDLRGWKRAKYTKRANELLELVGLSDQEKRYPRELSGGMRQRVALCRALLHEPQVLLLDEPFGALDALTRERLNVEVSLLCTRWQNAALLVTHDIGEAVFLGDRVVVMGTNPGRVVETVDVPLAHPRQLSARAEPEYSNALAHIRQILVQTGAYES
jgi:NitT/TauT family transport system ATP-binding protein